LGCVSAVFASLLISGPIGPGVQNLPRGEMTFPTYDRSISPLLIQPGWQDGAMGLNAAEKKGLTDALFIRNLTPADLNFIRRSGKEPGMKLVQAGIDQPVDAMATLMRLHAAPKDGPWAALSAALPLLSDSPLSAPTRNPVTIPDTVPAQLRPVIGSLVEAIASANKEITAALAPLTPAERRVLIDSLPQLAAGPKVKFDFVKAAPAKAREVDALVAKISMPTLLGAAVHLSTAINQQLSTLQTLKVDVPQAIEFTAGGVPVEIGSTGHDVHSKAVGGLCIDLGGDDVYTGRYGAGAGLASVVIDLGGNDDYEVHDLAMGAGLIGVGLAYDLGGNDRFSGGSLTYGAGLAGVGMFYKNGGDDTYISGSLTQGFGRSGLGLLLDAGGMDRYRVASLGQGSGQKNGIGWLADITGDDEYVANGPRCQGAGAEGIGLLSDEQGDDRYDGTSECQAFGANFGLGSLLDAAGRDSYISDHASASFATDSGAAYLFDLAGSDIYAVRGAACLGTAQARSVAVLLDRAGDDLYGAGDGRPGLATDDSLAVFLDGDGHDRYSVLPGGSVIGRFGDALSLFIDLAGSDGYPEGIGSKIDGSVRVDLDGGIVFDAHTPASGTATGSPDPTPGSIKDPGLDAIDRLWDDPSSEASDRLVGIGVPALRRFLDTRLASADTREMATAVRLVHVMGPSARPMVANALPKGEEAGDIPTGRNEIELAGVAMAGEAAPKIARLLKIPGFEVEAAEAAGLLRVKEAVADLLPLAGSTDPELARAASLALERINDEQSLSTAQALVASSQYPVRQAAMRFLAKYSASATRTANRLIADPDESTQRLGVELLGRMGSPEALTLVGGYLSGGTPGLKIQAILALQGKCPPALRQTLLGLREDPDPLVKAAALGIDLGR